jgi:hypothetical protein
MPDFRHQHGIDQLTGVAISLAAPVAAFYSALVRDGVPPEHAAVIAGQFTRQLLSDFGEAPEE